jgi:hypothetical protein
MLNSGIYAASVTEFSRRPGIRGLNKNHNHDLKNIFKGAAMRAAAAEPTFQEFYAALLAEGMEPSMARLTLESSPPIGWLSPCQSVDNRVSPSPPRQSARWAPI